MGSPTRWEENYTVVALDNLHVSPGWFDTSVSFGEPGYEERETLQHGVQVAAKSGFTHVAINPNIVGMNKKRAIIYQISD